MAQQNIKQIIKQEYIKCAKDPVYFMKKYCWIQHPTRGRTQFNLYPFQEKLLTLLTKHDKSVILKSRQLGISTLSAGIALHMMLFQKDKNILVIATKQETAKNLVTKVRFMYDQLPSWLKLPSVENNRLSIRLKNGSQIKAVPTSEMLIKLSAVLSEIVKLPVYVPSLTPLKSNVPSLPVIKVPDTAFPPLSLRVKLALATTFDVSAQHLTAQLTPLLAPDMPETLLVEKSTPVLLPP